MHFIFVSYYENTTLFLNNKCYFYVISYVRANFNDTSRHDTAIYLSIMLISNSGDVYLLSDLGAVTYIAYVRAYNPATEWLGHYWLNYFF